MSDPFDQAFAFVVQEEGGFTDDPRDPGNWTGGAIGRGDCHGTNWGISAASFPTLDIRALTKDGARAIYRQHYWTPAGADRLPPPLALLVFDAAVNNGVGRAIRWLQQALCVPEDGVLGDHTLAAATAHPGAALCAEYLARRTDFMARLPGWSVFGLGWARRLTLLPFTAIQMES